MKIKLRRLENSKGNNADEYLLQTITRIDNQYTRKVIKDYNLKNTIFALFTDSFDPDAGIVDEVGGNIILWIANPESEETIRHEGVHAFFRERESQLWNEYGEKWYEKNISRIVTQENLEEITAAALSESLLPKCNQYQHDFAISPMLQVPYNYPKEMLNKISRLYNSIYQMRCVCHEDETVIHKVRKESNPKEAYNILARYVGYRELI